MILVVNDVLSDAIVMPFSSLIVPEQMEHLSPLFPDPEPSYSIPRRYRRRRMKRALVDPLNPEHVEVDEADEGVPAESPLNLNLFPSLQPSTSDSPLLEQRPTGLWSDKTQLTIAVMKSITQEQGIDMYSILEEHVESLSDALSDGSLLSWPSTIRYSIQSIALSNSVSESWLKERDFLESHSVRPPASASVTYFSSGNDSSLSDGFLPKLAPMAAYYATRDLSTYSRARKLWELERVISITHSHPLAYVCGIVYATFLERIYRLEDVAEIGDYVVRQLILMELFSVAMEMESDFGEEEGHFSKALSWVISNTEYLDVSSLHSRCHNSSRPCVSTLIWTLGLFLIEGISAVPVRLTENLRAAFDAKLSLSASLVGSICGRSSVHLPYVDQLHRLDELLEVARRFSVVLLLPTATRPSDVEPAESLEFVESDDKIIWATPYRPNGPLIAEALAFQPLLGSISSFFTRFWRITKLGDFLEWLTAPTPLKVSALLISINYLAYLGASTLINHGRAITAPQPPDHEHAIHQRYFPVLLPSSGGETRAFKESNRNPQHQQ